MSELKYNYYREMEGSSNLFFRKKYSYSEVDAMYTAFVICANNKVGSLTSKASTLLEAMSNLDNMLNNLTDQEISKLYENIT